MAVFPVATYGLRLMIYCAVIELLVWSLNCCVVAEITKKLFQIEIQTNLEIESQMTLKKLKRLGIYGTRVQRFSHVLVKLIRYYDWYRLIVDFR